MTMDTQNLHNKNNFIQTYFNNSVNTKQQTAKLHSANIAAAAQLCIECLVNNKKILICGNGGSAADAQHFSAELLNRFEMERPALPAIALTTDTSSITAIGNDYEFSKIFEKQIQALGQPEDVLIAISTSGNSTNINLAISTAKAKGMNIIGLSGKDGGQMKKLMLNNLNIIVPAFKTSHIQETHIVILHLICALIDQGLFDNS